MYIILGLAKALVVTEETVREPLSRPAYSVIWCRGVVFHSRFNFDPSTERLRAVCSSLAGATPPVTGRRHS